MPMTQAELDAMFKSITPSKKKTDSSQMTQEDLDAMFGSLAPTPAPKSPPVTSQEIASLQAELSALPVRPTTSPVVSTVAPGMGQFNSFLTGTGRIAAVPTVEPPAPVTITTTSGISPQTTKTQEAFGIPMSTWEATNPGSEQPISFLEKNVEYIAALPKQTWEAFKTATLPFNELLDVVVGMPELMKRKDMTLGQKLGQIVTKDVPQIVKDQAAVVAKAIGGLGQGLTMGAFDIQHGVIQAPGLLQQIFPALRGQLKSATDLDTLFKFLGVNPEIINETGMEGTSQLIGNLLSLKAIEGGMGKIPVGAKTTLGDLSKLQGVAGGGTKATGLIGTGARAAQTTLTGATSGMLTPGTTPGDWAGSAAMFGGMSLGGEFASRVMNRLANANGAAKYPAIVRPIETAAGMKYMVTPAFQKTVGTVTAALSGALAASPFGGNISEEFANQLVLGLAMQLMHKSMTPAELKKAVQEKVNAEARRVNAQVEADRVKAAQEKVPTQEQPVADIPPPVVKKPQEMTREEIDGSFPVAGETVSGLRVRKEIPNQDSIDASIDSPVVLRGVRSVPVSLFGEYTPPTSGSKTDLMRTEELRRQIGESGEISPLIVVVDAEGAYVLEGGHRFDALLKMGAKEIPALVVVDNGSLSRAKEGTTPTSPPRQVEPVIPEPVAETPPVAPKKTTAAGSKKSAAVESAGEKAVRKPQIISEDEFYRTNTKVEPGRDKYGEGERLDSLPEDAELWVYHATDKNTAESFVKDGVKQVNRPWNLARERYESGQYGEFAPGRGLSSGLTVGSNPMDVSGYGRQIVAIKIKKSQLRVSPEAEMLGNKTAGHALAINDAYLEGDIPAGNIVLIGEPGRYPKDGYTELVKAGALSPPSIESLTPGGETVIGGPPVKKSKATLESAKGHASKATEAAKSALKELFADSERGSVSPKDASEKAAAIKTHLETLWREAKAAGKDFGQWVEEVVAEFGEKARSHAMALQPGQKEPEKKVSKLRTNTIERSTEIPEEIKSQMLKEDYEYIPETTRGQREEAIRNVEADRATVEARLEDKVKQKQPLTATEQAEFHLLYMAKQDKVLKTGDPQAVNDLTSFMARMRPSAATEVGRAMQALNANWQKTTPEGAVKIYADNISEAREKAAKNNPAQAREAKTEGDLLIERIREIDRTETDPAKANAAKAKFIAEYFNVPTAQPKQPKAAITPKVAPKKVTARQVYDNFRAANKDLAAGLDALFGGAQRGSISPEPANFAEKYAKAKPIFEKAWSEFKAAGKDFNQLVNEFVKQHGEGIRSYLLRFKADVVTKEKNREQLEKRLTTPQKTKPRKNLLDQVEWCIENNVFDDAALTRLVNIKRGIPELTPDVVQFVTEQMNVARSLPEGRAKRAAIWRAQYTVASALPVTMRAKLRGVLRITLLTNPKTFIRNIGGNVVIGAAEATRENTVGAFVDLLTSLATGKRTTIAAPITKGKAFFKGVGVAGKEMKQDLAERVDTSTTRSMAEMPRGRTFQNPVLNTLEGFVGKLLQVGDRPFYEGWRNSRIEELKKINKTQTVTEEMELDARLYALDKVFQNDSALAARARRIREDMGILGEFVMPFVQTPANIFDKLIDYSPGGLVRGVIELGRVKKGTFNQKVFVDRVSRGLTGSGLMVLGYFLAKSGILTGAPSSDKDTREFNRNTGWQPYAIKLGNSYYSYDWMQPAGGMLAAGADFFVSGKGKPKEEQKNAFEKVMRSLMGASDTLVNQSFLQGVVTMFSGYSISEGVVKTLQNAPLMFLPTGTKQLGQAIDPYVRDTSTFGGKVAAKVPGATYALPKKLDAFGQPIKSYQGRDLLSKLPEIFVSPGNFSQLDNSPAVRLIRDLSDRTGETKHIPRVAPTKLTLPGGREAKLTQEQRDFYQKFAGELTLKLFTARAQDRQFMNAKDEVKVKILYNILTAIAAAAREQTIRQFKLMQ